MNYEDVFVVYCTECDNSEILVKGESVQDYRCSMCGAPLEKEEES